MQDIHHQTAAGGTLSRFSYAYDAVGNIGTWTQQYEATIRAYDFTYDAAEQLTAATHRTTDITPTILTRYRYGYDAVGNRTGDQIDEVATTGTHDVMNRLTARVGGGVLAFDGTVSEPATVTVQGTPAVVDSANRFTGAAAVASGTTTVTVAATDASGNTRTQAYEVDAASSSSTLSYDANGNLTAQGSKTYEWDATNRLMTVKDGATELARFTYDGFGRRAQKVAGGVTRSYIYDSEDILEERISGGATSRHVHGPGIDQPLATVDGSGTPSYYLADHLGSVVQTTNAAGQVTLTRQYDPFGRMLAGSTVQGYAFTGREWDPETGLYYYRARYFDPAIGRFISADPAGFVDGPNHYAYVGNSPIAWRDPLGLQIWPTNFPVVTSPYGGRRGTSKHTGADVRNPLGNPVRSTDPGTVIEAGNNADNGGNEIRILNDDGSISGYAHTKPTVGKGDRVTEGQHIGDSDGSGTGAPHLHLTYRKCATCPKEDPIPRLRKPTKSGPCPE